MSIQNTPQDEFDPQANALGEIERAIVAGAALALRARAAVQRKKAADGTSPEAATAANLADAFERLADEIESETAR